MDRRNFVKSVGASAVGLSFAGCMGDQGAGQEEGTGTATGTGIDVGDETTAAAEGETTAAEEGAEMNTTETETNATAGGAGGGDLQLEQRQGQAPPGIQVENLQIMRTDSGDDGGARVTGTITNAGDTTYEQIEVQVTLLDNTDDVLGQYFDNTEGEEITPLEPQEQFEFSIDFPSADLGDAVGYRVDVDTDIDEGFDVDWNLNGTSNETGNATDGV